VLFIQVSLVKLTSDFPPIKLKRTNSEVNTKSSLKEIGLMQRSLEDLRQELQILKPTLKKRFKVETIDIFGSYARGEQTEKSDLDLLITWSIPEDLFLIYDLRQYLKRKLRLKVDIIAKEFLNKHIKEHVIEEAVPV
jgi:hypothetical protein